MTTNFMTQAARALLPALLCAALCSPARAARPVVELEPQELAAFVQQHGLAVIQFTSPDRNCTYCVGADRTFDGSAALSTHPKLVFARVQWPVWNAIPSFKPLFTNLYGVPTQILFKNGKVHRRATGRPYTPEALLAQFNDMLKQPPDPDNISKIVFEPQAARQALTVDEQRLVALNIRRGYIGQVIANCGKYFPDQVAGYEAGFAGWKDRRSAELLESERLVALHTGAQDAAIVKTLSAAEMQLQRDLQKRLEVPTGRAPLAHECPRVLEAIFALP